MLKGETAFCSSSIILESINSEKRNLSIWTVIVHIAEISQLPDVDAIGRQAGEFQMWGVAGVPF